MHEIILLDESVTDEAKREYIDKMIRLGISKSFEMVKSGELERAQLFENDLRRYEEGTLEPEEVRIYGKIGINCYTEENILVQAAKKKEQELATELLYETYPISREFEKNN